MSTHSDETTNKSSDLVVAVEEPKVAFADDNPYGIPDGGLQAWLCVLGGYVTFKFCGIR